LFPDRQPGVTVDGTRCENIESLTFEDNSIDLHITQDVMEHVFRPELAFKEIARTLKPGGAHVFTVPLVKQARPSQRRACKEDGAIKYLEEPKYHGNPVSDKGSLVTVDWGYDICRYIFEASGLITQVIHIDDITKGIRANYIDVLVSMKM
jgi:SAM-dependent methyltransferase